jgi:hypothetical protein
MTLARSCGHSEEHGVFTWCLAVAIRRLGLRVRYFGDRDPRPQRRERECRSVARRLGVIVGGKATLDELLSMVRTDTIPVVFFDTAEGTGHFSPLLGASGGRLLLPYVENGTGTLDRRTFLKRWRAEGVLRQAIVVSS